MQIGVAGLNLFPTILTAIQLLFIPFLSYLLIRRVKLHHEFRQKTIENYHPPTAVSVAGRVSVIVPFRDEPLNVLANSLRSLLSQNYEDLEVIAVNDSATPGSLDLVSRIALEDAKLRHVKAGQPPDGWTGKNWACHQGLLNARGKVFLFTDSDTMLGPEAVSKSVAYLEEKQLNMLSLKPRFVPSRWSLLTHPSLSYVINMLFPPSWVGDDRKNTAYLVGSFIMVTKKAYQLVGGHAGIRSELVEDRMLGERGKQTGLKIDLLNGEKLFSSYASTSWSDSWNTLIRVISSSVRKRPLYGILFAVGAGIVSLSPPLSLVAALVAGDLVSLAIAIVALTLLCGNLAVDVREMDRSTAFAVTAPLSGSIFAAAVLSATLKVLRRRPITWKGRKYFVHVSNETDWKT